MKVLQQMLGQLPTSQFLDKHFTRLPYSSTLGAKAFTHLLTWKKVENILDQKKSILRIVHNGKVIKDYVELNFEEAQQHHQQGHTLLLRFAEKSDHALLALAKDFATSFHTEVDIQLYCTPEGHNAFGWHYDVEEVFIIQAKGSKHYKIRPNTVHPNPLVLSIPKDLQYENEKSDIEINVTLEEGDWLYIPSGWWHIAETKKESMHISIGLMPKSAIDVASFLPKYLAQSSFWRTRMPLHQEFKTEEEQLQFFQMAFEKLGVELAKNVASPDFIRAFFTSSKVK